MLLLKTPDSGQELGGLEEAWKCELLSKSVLIKNRPLVKVYLLKRQN